MAGAPGSPYLIPLVGQPKPQPMCPAISPVSIRGGQVQFAGIPCVGAPCLWYLADRSECAILALARALPRAHDRGPANGAD